MKSFALTKLTTALSLIGAVASTGFTPYANAQTAADTKKIESIIVTGTRQSNRTVFDSMAPVDLINGETIDNTISEDLLDSITQLVPSFKVQRLPMADGQVFVRPATLRGLSPDHTLVLINGKRMHRSALLGSNGAQAADLSSIPSYAIKRIEVLRDGASAQYGSDAIAGVINIILDDEDVVKAFSQFSQYFKGDGQGTRAGIQAGTELSDDGFISGTIEYYDSERTSRSRQRADATAYQQAHPEIKLRDPVQDWGQPDREALRFAINSQYYISDSTALYAFGTYTDGEGSTDFNWRNPESGVYNQSTVYPGFNLLDIYPAGFSPLFGQDDTDISFYTGLKGTKGALNWDLSFGAGSNKIEYNLANSINASMGPNSPTEFNTGSLKQSEKNINFDGVYLLENNVFADDINIAFGGEWRQETYTVTAGEEASYLVGPAANEGLPSGSNGFFGFSPPQSGRFSQDSYAGYVDLETQLSEQWMVGLAGRYEDFSEFGNSTNGKISSRYSFTDQLAFRATLSTGFRAPTPGQLFSEKVSQGLDTDTLEVFTRGRYSPQGDIAAIINQRNDAEISALKPEKSDNLSFGFTYQNNENLSASIDFYRIKISDRFGTSTTFNLNPQERQQLVDLGVTGAESIASVNFYQNDFDTLTRGIDLVVSKNIELASGSISLVGAYNFNETEVTAGDLSSNETQRVLLEDRLPKQSGNLTTSYKIGDFNYSATVRYYGKWTDSSGNADGDIFQTFGDEIFFDIGANYHLTEQVKLSFKVENLFDNYPEEATFQSSRGLIYSRNAPYDSDGGNYALSIDINF